MDRLRHKFKRCLFGGEDGVEFNCAFSGGNIEWRKDIGVSYKDAGAASYDSKKKGRNRVTVRPFYELVES